MAARKRDGAGARGNARAGPAGWRRWLLRLALAIVAPGLFFALPELGLRVAGYGYHPGFFVESTIDGRKVHVENRRFTWRFFPPALARPPDHIVVPLAKPDGTCRIFVLGGSAARGDPAPEFGFARDFDVYSEIAVDAENEDFGGGERLYKDFGFGRPMAWIREHHRKEPFFLFLHTYAVHVHYAAPPEVDDVFGFRSNSGLPKGITQKHLSDFERELAEADAAFSDDDLAHVVESYDRGIRYTDTLVGELYELLESLEILDDTLLIITADHGEEFLNHGHFGHNQIYGELLRVPLVIRWPGKVPKGAVVNSKVESVDIVPTVMNLLGIRQTSRYPGRDLLETMRMEGGQDVVARPVFSNRSLFMSFQHRGLSLLLDGRVGNQFKEELYRLTDDPGQKENIFDRRAEEPVYNELISRMMFYLGECVPGWNIIAIPDEGEQIRIRLRGFKPERFVKSTLSRSYSGSDFDLIWLQNAVTVNKTSLIQFSGEYKDTFVLRLESLRGGDSGPLEARFIDEKGGRELESPLRIGEFFERECPYSMIEGLPDSALENTKVIIWFTPMRFKVSQEGAEELSEEALENLRNLGYLQ